MTRKKKEIMHLPAAAAIRQTLITRQRHTTAPELLMVGGQLQGIYSPTFAFFPVFPLA